MTKELTSISIPKQLADKLKEKIKGTPFHTVSSYITFIMRLIILESENDKEAITKKDEENVKLKLKKLGYL
jgi:Arc/MetJ-type ribon-helix-helix transcriptional regulator